MNKKDGHHDKTTGKVFPSRDSGGSGDSIFNHQTPKKSRHLENKHKDINSNKFLEKEEELEEDFKKIGAEIVKMVVDVAEKHIRTEGEEGRPESANGEQKEVTQDMMDEGEMLPMKAQVVRHQSVEGTEDEIVQDVGDKKTKKRKRKDTNKDAMKKFGVDEEMVKESTDITSTQQQLANTQDAFRSTEAIKQRYKPNKTSLEKTVQCIPSRRIQVGAYEPTPLAADEDDWVTTVLLMILFFLFTVLFALIFSYFYCRDNRHSEMCAEFKGDLNYWYMRIQYSYKYYLGSVRK